MVPAERLPYYPASRRPAAGQQKFRADDATADDHAAWLRMYRAQIDLIGLLRRSGAGFLAGSDTGPWNRMLPGFSLHDELDRMVAAGFSPLEALQAATVNPARALGLTDSLGAIRPGLSGDLLLLDADPLADIANLRRIRAVVVRGRLVDQTERTRLLAEVARAAGQL
jgi:imidazolonepropionase-like amidohydrolase